MTTPTIQAHLVRLLRPRFTTGVGRNGIGGCARCPGYTCSGAVAIKYQSFFTRGDGCHAHSCKPLRYRNLQDKAIRSRCFSLSSIAHVAAVTTMTEKLF